MNRMTVERGQIRCFGKPRMSGELLWSKKRKMLVLLKSKASWYFCPRLPFNRRLSVQWQTRARQKFSNPALKWIYQILRSNGFHPSCAQRDFTNFVLKWISSILRLYGFLLIFKWRASCLKLLLAPLRLPLAPQDWACAHREKHWFENKAPRLLMLWHNYCRMREWVKPRISNFDQCTIH